MENGSSDALAPDGWKIDSDDLMTFSSTGRRRPRSKWMENRSGDALVPNGWKEDSEDSAIFQCLFEDHCVDDDGDVANGQKLNSAKHYL